MAKARHKAPPTGNVVVRWGLAYYRFNTAVHEALVKALMTRPGCLVAIIALLFISYHMNATLAGMVYPYIQVPIVIAWNIFAVFGYKVLISQIMVPQKF